MPRSARIPQSIGPGCLFRSIIAAAMITALSGCVGYTNWPSMGKGDSALKNPNLGAPTDVMGVAFNWLLEAHPPGDAEHPYEGPVAVNLPYGVNSRTYERVVRQAGHGAVAPTREGALPTYHMVQVRVRAGQAEVDLMRPLPGSPPASREADDYQMFTVKLQGGLQAWAVEYSRPYAAGLWTPPGLNPIESVREAEEAGEIVKYGG